MNLGSFMFLEKLCNFLACLIKLFGQLDYFLLCGVTPLFKRVVDTWLGYWLCFHSV